MGSNPGECTSGLVRGFVICGRLNAPGVLVVIRLQSIISDEDASVSCL